MSESLYAGLTSQSIDLLLQDSSSMTGAGMSGLVFNSAGLIASYRKGATGIRTAITLAAQTVAGAYVSGGFVEIDPTHMKGVYRLDVPNAAIDTQGFVTLHLYGATNLLATSLRVDCRPIPVVTTVTTATNLTNAPTVGDLTAAMKASVTAAVPTVAAINTAVEAGTVGAGVTTLQARLTASRATYLDFLNVGSALASQADVLAINQSASRRLILTTVQQYERPEAGNVAYTVEARTYTANGALVNADVTPTLTGTGSLTGTLAANISVAANPAVGVYRWAYTVHSTGTEEQIRFDVSATMTTVFTLSAYAQVTDCVASTWTNADRTKLESVFNKLPSRAYLTGTAAAAGSLTTADLGLAAGNVDTQLGAISAKIGTPVGASVSVDVAAVKADIALRPTVVAIQAGLATAVAVAAVQAGVNDVPTNAELAVALAVADDPTLIAIAAVKADTLIGRHGASVILGAIANAGTSNETYVHSGITVTYVGLDASGNRTGVTIT